MAKGWVIGRRAGFWVVGIKRKGVLAPAITPPSQEEEEISNCLYVGIEGRFALKFRVWKSS